jgi:peptide/nickel transport system substrate-binding protein
MLKKRVIPLTLLIICLLVLTHSEINPDSNTFTDEEGNTPGNHQTLKAVGNAKNASALLTIGSLGLHIGNYDPAILAHVGVYRSYSLLYDTLVTYNSETGKIMPNLAKQWIVSNDSKYWLFTLKQNIFFHDGSKFNASAVKFSFSRLFDPNNPAYVPKEGNDLPLKSIKIKSEYEIIFNFLEPHAPFIYDEAANLYIISPNSFNGSILINPIGTGPYSIDLSTSNSTLQNFTRFNSHFKGLAPFERIHYRMYTSYTNLVDGLITQEVDLVPDFYPNIDEYFLTDENWNLTISNKSYTTMFGWFNHERSKIADLNVRLALNHAINRQPLIDFFDGYASISRSIIPPSAPFYDDEVLGYPYDAEKAINVLEDAGYEISSDGYRFTIEIVTLATLVPPYLMDPIISDLNTVGIHGNVTYLNSIEEIALRWLNGEFDIFLLGGSLVLNPQMEYDHFHSAGSHNNGVYSNSDVDAFLDLSLESPVFQERNYYLKQMHQLIQQDAAFLLLINLNPFYARKTVITPHVDLLHGRFIFSYLPPPNLSLKVLTDQKTLSQQDREVFFMENVELSNLSIYFPFTDAIITTEGTNPVKVNISMSHNLEAFIPSQEQKGKFYLISADTPEVNYHFRCYYDLSEIEGLSPVHLTLFQYDENQGTWLRVKTLASNSSLQYVEIELRGGYKLLRLGESIIQITYRNLPLFSLIIGSMVSFALLTVFFNQVYINRFKVRFNL